VKVGFKTIFAMAYLLEREGRLRLL
jgi:hypothetical protein